MKKKHLIITIIAAVLTAASVAAVIFINNKSNARPDAGLREHSIAHFFIDKEKRTRFLIDAAPLSDNIAGNIDAYLSVDGAVEAVRAATALYRADANGILLVYPAAVDKAVLSLDNRYLLFSTASKVILYDHERDKLIELSGLPGDGGRALSLAVSPGGRTCAVSIAESSGTKLNTYICVNTEPEIPNTEFSLYKENACICAVSDDGETAYYMETEGRELTGRLYYRKNGRDRLITENIEANFEITRNLREITFDIEGKTYCSVNGGRPAELTGASCFSNAGKCFSMMGGELLDVRLKDTDTLLNSVFYNYYPASDSGGNTYAAYDLYYVDSARRGRVIAKGATQFNVSDDEKSLLVLVDSELYAVSVFKPDEPALVASGVYTYCASRDFRDIYTVDTKANLWYRHYENNAALSVPKRGALTAANVFTSLMSRDGVCFFMSDYDAAHKRGSLNAVRNGQIEIIADDAGYFEVLSGMTLYYTDAGGGLYDVYACAEGTEFKKVMEGARLAG